MCYIVSISSSVLIDFMSSYFHFRFSSRVMTTAQTNSNHRYVQSVIDFFFALRILPCVFSPIWSVLTRINMIHLPLMSILPHSTVWMHGMSFCCFHIIVWYGCESIFSDRNNKQDVESCGIWTHSLQLSKRVTFIIFLFVTLGWYI